MFNSLRVRLLLTLLIVVGVALAIMAIYISRTTTSEFQQSVVGILRYRNLRLDRKISSIQDYVAQHAGEEDIWAGLQGMMDSMASSSQTRFVLADLDGKVYADSSHELIGQNINVAQSKPFAVYLVEGIPILAYYEQLDIPQPEQIQRTFIESVNRSLLIAILVTGLLALLLTLLLSNSILSPIGELTGAARKMEQGDLSQRVQVRPKGELGDLAQAFNAMAVSLQHAEQLRRNMVSDVAHELRTPLSNLRGYLEAMQDGVLVPTPASIASLHEDVMLLNHLVDDLQELALVEAGQIRLEKRSTELDRVVEKALSITDQEASFKGVTLNASGRSCVTCWIMLLPTLHLVETFRLVPQLKMGWWKCGSGILALVLHLNIYHISSSASTGLISLAPVPLVARVWAWQLSNSSLKPRAVVSPSKARLTKVQK
jgi:nitrate/nitrite-specific signal transduction histidine kinase